MRKAIEFRTEDGVTLRGWHYLPARRRGRLPTVIMAHGFSAVKEMYLDRYAELFSRAGLAALVYDNRGFGASDGSPRQEIDPLRQVRDYRDAITFAETLKETDGDRIGVWGSSYSGGHVLAVAAQDRRVKAAVSQVPMTSGSRNVQRLIRADLMPAIRAMFEADRRARFAGQPPGMIPVVSDDPSIPAALPSAESFSWMTGTAQKRAKAWRNEVTVRSIEMLSEYEPAATIHLISPTPLLMIVALKDDVAVADEALAAYERALQPKSLVTLKGCHFDAYTHDFKVAGGKARDWFVEHLLRA